MPFHCDILPHFSPRNVKPAEYKLKMQAKKFFSPSNGFAQFFGHGIEKPKTEVFKTNS